jgi:Immunity protein 74
MLEGPSGLAIFANSIRAWQPPFQDEPIDDAKRQSIVDNIRRAFRFDGFEIEVR